MLEEEGGDPQLLGLELLEDVLGVVGAVVAADAGVVAAYDEVGPGSLVRALGQGWQSGFGYLVRSAG